MVRVLVEVGGTGAAPEQARAAALDLAAQQAGCLRAEAACGPVRVPVAFALVPDAEATPAP